jgi:hypothetical protein
MLPAPTSSAMRPILFPGHKVSAAARRRQRSGRGAPGGGAGDALWMFMVQREACGLRDSRSVMREHEYNVHNGLQHCIGAIPVTSMRAATDSLSFSGRLRFGMWSGAALDAFARLQDRRLGADLIFRTQMNPPCRRI